ncbi:Zinc finger, PHD-type [Sesbania bispinosa]|nr:Zinc finger, PHD-type [Sesbania bispinosa]
MAFHVACPITCRRICYCSLGFPRSLHGPNNNPINVFDHDVAALRDFLADTRRDDTTIQVAVPKVVPPPPEAVPVAGDALDESASMKAKRVALQRKGAAAMIAAEEYARRFESADVVDTSGNFNGEEQGQSNVKVFCRMCNRVENEGSERAKKMLSCKSCGKKYHRNCLRSWAQNRDLFHWSSWTCRACRICEACRRTGDPSKFMFCKRCDGAYHCYCLQPPHKNVSTGPYLCPKHTRCHSCGSNVPGNGLSVRWFLGYTCCDACGRLFVKGNYCPVCLKVYRDSESTPMVCCDICQRWVHCQCDNISDEKYHHFQVDGNLQYTCPTCRGECYQVKSLEDAVQELWRRRNIADKDLITSLRAAAGLPTQEEIFSISPYSDDEDSGPLKLKSESARSFKFSLKNLSNNSPKKMKDYGKKSSSKKSAKKKDSQSFLTEKIDTLNSFEGHSDIKSLHSLDDDKNDDIQSQRNEGPDVYSSPATGSLSQTEVSCPITQSGVLKHKFVDEVMVSDEERKPRVVRIKSNKAHILDSEEESGKRGDKSQNVKGKKLVINLGARKINVASSPRSDNSSCQRDQDLVTVNGNEDVSHLRKGDKFASDRHDGTARHIDGKGNRVDSGQSKFLKVSGREGNLIKLGKIRPSEFNQTASRGKMSDGCGVPLERAQISRGKRSTDGINDQVGIEATLRGERTYLGKQSEGSSDAYDEADDNNNQTPSHSLPKDSKPLLKFKFKKPSIESQSTHQEEEKTTIKGQRSKRKRPSPFKDKTSFNGSEDVSQPHQDSVLDEIMDANWILMKLGSDAIGKRVEVHQASDNSWHKGLVTDIVEGTSKLYVTLDDGKVNILDLRKQGARFVPNKQKRTKT